MSYQYGIILFLLGPPTVHNKQAKMLLQRKKDPEMPGRMEPPGQSKQATSMKFRFPN